MLTYPANVERVVDVHVLGEEVKALHGVELLRSSRQFVPVADPVVYPHILDISRIVKLPFSYVVFVS